MELADSPPTTDVFRAHTAEMLDATAALAFLLEQHAIGRALSGTAVARSRAASLRAIGGR